MAAKGVLKKRNQRALQLLAQGVRPNEICERLSIPRGAFDALTYRERKRKAKEAPPDVLVDRGYTLDPDKFKHALLEWAKEEP